MSLLDDPVDGRDHGAGPVVSSEAHAIACTGLGKAYMIYARPEDRLKEWLKGSRLGEAFWALRDVSLDIRPGQTVGIIGCNGSGKSTFLQLVAGVLKPTEGVLHTRGRVAAL
uniref:ATP-binding cassette domain-containing protein n=1 Tax=Ferrovum sp. TaxID=2609467 RepID=UPI0026322372